MPDQHQMEYQAHGRDHDALFAMSQTSLVEVSREALQELSNGFSAEVSQAPSNYFRSYSNIAPDSFYSRPPLVPQGRI